MSDKERIFVLQKNVNDTIKKNKTDKRVFFGVVLISIITLASLLHTMIGGLKL